MVLLIDNYDSFTFNLYQYLSELGAKVIVQRNDRITLEKIEEIKPHAIVISPGPSTPLNTGICNEVIRHFSPRLPILGVCLGHQCIGYTFGATIQRAKEIMHGKSSLIYHDNQGILKGLPNPFSAIRYHSLVVANEGLPDCLKVTCWTADGTIMGIRHHEYPVEGVQFHPESFMTENGKEIMRNFLNMG